ncbi:MAG: tRNA (N6-isopentenyl adenosine(37)-C2)-methylthiotransferase MiaB [Gammaproteobacteria bacterium]|nr:tRNA (N6-isopentenyl adenosine(37)-C2)-methylthiotransferase MiaB [Gammaproteobacteria bacterium]
MSRFRPAEAIKTGQKLFIKTFGCQMNEYDSRRMADLLAKSHGLSVTGDPEQADVLLLNTCSVREKAQEKVFSQLGRWREWKLENPDLVIGVGGCVASQEGQDILDRAPYVDIVFGPQTLHRLPQLIDECLQDHRGVMDTSFPEIEKFDALPEPRAEGPTAFVSIMEGCNKYCSFCVVPFTRGEEFSRPFDDVLAEIVTLAEQGVREVNLLGQNVNAYRGDRHDGSIADLALLIQYVAEVEGIERIRFTTSHPLEFSDVLIDAYASIPKLVKHLHLPVQSGSNRILSLMKRGYTAQDYLQIIEKLKQVSPGISLSSDFIIGFPGETEADFRATMDLVETVGFDHSFSFIYSARPGTLAAELEDAVPMAEKKQRLAILQKQIQENAAGFSQDMVGTLQTVLVSGVSKKSDSEISGRTENNRVVNFAGSSRYIGQMLDVRITDALPNSLRGMADGIETPHSIPVQCVTG